MYVFAKELTETALTTPWVVLTENFLQCIYAEKEKLSVDVLNLCSCQSK